MDEIAGTDGRQVTGLVLNDLVVAALQGVLPAVAERTVAAVTVEVPSYADAFSGRMGQRIEGAVQMALGAFLQLAARPHDSDPVRRCPLRSKARTNWDAARHVRGVPSTRCCRPIASARACRGASCRKPPSTGDCRRR